MHGNTKKNDNQHHLYRIFKKADGETFKYGISDDPIEADGLSSRMRDQLEEWNMAAEYEKFGAEIILQGISGREQALVIELNYIDAYYELNGRNPKWNRYPKRIR